MRRRRAVRERETIDPAAQMLDQLVDAHGIKATKKVLAKQAGYVDVPPTIQEFMEDPYYLGDIYDLYPVWQKCLGKIYPNEFFSPYLEVCLTGDTKVDLADGRSLALRQIVERFGQDEFDVISFNTELQVWETDVGFNATMTHISAPVHNIELSTGEVIQATADHPFLTEGMEWVKAKDLKEGHCLKSYRRRNSGPDPTVKTPVYNMDPWKRSPATHCQLSVISVTYCGKRPVYNLTVKKNHNYRLSCGIVSHNCLSGAIGLGKTTVSLVGSAYDMCKLQFMESPTEYCVLSRNTKLAFAMINANMELSKTVLMDQISDIVEQSPYFKELRAEAMLSKARSKSFLPKNVNVIQGSRFTHTLGQAVIGAVLSELNFQDRVKDQAYDNYTGALTRLQSRFMACKMRTGSYPGRLWLDSSKNDANSFVESHVASNKNNPEMLLLDYAFWEVHAERMNYCGKTFEVFIGDQNRDPFIVEHVRQTIGLPDECVIDVPVEHLPRFEQNLPKSLRDIAGKGTWSSSKLIPTVERINQCLKRKNPVSQEEIHLDFFDKNQTLLMYLDIQAIQADTRPRFIHVDLGLKNDRTGIASTRLDGWVTTQHIDPHTLKTNMIKEPLFHTEWVMAIKAIPGQEVPIWKIKDLIILLRQRGVPVAQVSTDGYQSTNLRQDLMRIGYQCKLLSVDRTKDPYTNLKDCILEGRWDGVQHSILEHELKNLIDTGKKIDHTISSSKDCADAVCGSVYAALQGLEDYAANNRMEDYAEVLDKMVNESHLYKQIARHNAR